MDEGLVVVKVSFTLESDQTLRLESDRPWLFEPAVSGKQCYVEIRGTFPSGYRNGIYEGRRGYVVSVFDPQSVINSKAEQEANVRLEGDDTTTPLLIEYLTPVPPQSAKDYVVALRGNGEVLVVRELMEGGSQCVVSRVPDGVMFEIPQDNLVQIQKPENL
jgi:hypothetical protein